jgi:hypothetical protein
MVVVRPEKLQGLDRGQTFPGPESFVTSHLCGREQRTILFLSSFLSLGRQVAMGLDSSACQ